MPTWSRRRALHALATGATALVAGCREESEFDDPPERRGGRPVSDYATAKVRDANGRPLVWSGEQPTETNRDTRRHHFLRSEDDVAELTFATNTDAAATLESFVRATDYETHSVLLRTASLEECYDLRLRGVVRQSDGVEARYCRPLRPADVACEAGERDTVGFAVRLPFPGGEIDSHGAHVQGECNGRPLPVALPANDSATSGGDDR